MNQQRQRIRLTLGKCPKCSKNSLKEVNEREVIGVTTCKMTGNKSVMSRRLNGVKCPLCNYNNVNGIPNIV